jgi:hypothetical protein
VRNTTAARGKNKVLTTQRTRKHGSIVRLQRPLSCGRGTGQETGQTRRVGGRGQQELLPKSPAGHKVGGGENQEGWHCFVLATPGARCSASSVSPGSVTEPVRSE